MTAFNVTIGDFTYDPQPDKVGDTYHRAVVVRGDYQVKIDWSNTRDPYVSLEITKGDHTVWADNHCQPPGWEANTLQAFIDTINRDYTIEDFYYEDTDYRLGRMEWDNMDRDRSPVKR